MVYIYCPSFLLDIDNNKIPLLSVVQIHATILQYVGREGEVLSYPDRDIYNISIRWSEPGVWWRAGDQLSVQLRWESVRCGRPAVRLHHNKIISLQHSRSCGC